MDILTTFILYEIIIEHIRSESEVGRNGKIRQSVEHQFETEKTERWWARNSGRFIDWIFQNLSNKLFHGEKVTLEKYIWLLSQYGFKSVYIYTWFKIWKSSGLYLAQFFFLIFIITWHSKSIMLESRPKQIKCRLFKISSNTFLSPFRWKESISKTCRNERK